MKLVVGLGNIGKEFEKTNHNMGFMVIDEVAKKLGASFKTKACASVIAELNHGGEKVILAKPTTYMNASGEAVKSLAKKYNINISSDMLIISDDIDLPASKVRVRPSGSAGTHNGLRNIVLELGSTSFPRLRIGVGKPDKDVDLTDFVVSKAKLDDNLKNGISRGVEACMMFVDGYSLDQIMQKVN